MRTLGGYRIRGLLGKGGMGAVYKVEHPVLGKLMALKLLAPVEHLVDLMGYDTLKEGFLREARIMASIRHPNVSQVWDYGEDAGRPFFIMEFACDNLGALMGETYRVEAPSRPLPPPMAMEYAMQTLRGLARLHHAGIIHRDIKPFNLLLTEDDRVKIIDFGLSKLRGETAQAGPDNVKIGSPYYAAPEQAEHPETAGVAADLYSVGVLLYRMLTGMLPPNEMEGEEKDDSLARRSAFYERWEALDPALSRHMRAFFVMSLHRDPARRHPSALAMAAEVASLREEFEEALSASCTLPESFLQEEPREVTDPPVQGAASALREEPLKTGPLDDLEQLQLDPLGRPLHPLLPRHQCESGPEAVEVATDTVRQRMWQRGGTPYPIYWEEAHTYISQLNAERFAGYSDWRLPTVAELVTCIDPHKEPGISCTTDCFHALQSTCWSADRRTFVTAWRLHATMGCIQWVDMHCHSYVRAVRTITSTPKESS